jgi:hypothetical protein
MMNWAWRHDIKEDNTQQNDTNDPYEQDSIKENNTHKNWVQRYGYYTDEELRIITLVFNHLAALLEFRSDNCCSTAFKNSYAECRSTKCHGAMSIMVASEVDYLNVLRWKPTAIIK